MILCYGPNRGPGSRVERSAPSGLDDVAGPAQEKNDGRRRSHFYRSLSDRRRDYVRHGDYGRAGRQAPQMIIGGKTCRSCEYRRVANGVVFCHRFPPQVMIVPMRDSAGAVSPGFQSVYPAVDPAMPCGEYRRSETFANEEVAGAATDGMMRQ